MVYLYFLIERILLINVLILLLIIGFMLTNVVYVIQLKPAKTTGSDQWFLLTCFVFIA